MGDDQYRDGDEWCVCRQCEDHRHNDNGRRRRVAIRGGSLTLTNYCTSSSDQIYVTASGGNPGISSTNSNILLLAAAGNCSGSSPAYGIQPFVWINEITTVAAGYALSGFTSIVSAGCTSNGFTITTPCVNITSDATNYATVSPNGTLSTAGLKHAFANAANLASTVYGTANTTITSLATNQDNISNTAVPGWTGNMPAYVPQTLINTIADIMTYCVNSLGGTAGDGSHCGNFFANTPPIGGTPYATNTLQSVLNLAKNPYPSSAAMTNLFGYVPSPVPFSPVLSAKPPDWSISIVYQILENTGVNRDRSTPIPTT